MRKKVLHVIDSIVYAGAQVLVANSLSKGGLQEEADNTLIYFMGSSSLQDRIDPGVEVICLNYKGIFDLYRCVAEIRKVIVHKEIDIVHSHLTPAGVYTYFACPKNIPHVHTMHSTYSMQYTIRFSLRLMEKYLLFRSKNCSLIFLTEYTRQDFLKAVRFKGRTYVLNNFIADEYFVDKLQSSSTDDKQLKVVAVGTLREEKNYEYLLKIFSYLKEYNISLDVYGNGDIEKFEKIVKENQLKVRFLGLHSEVYKILYNYDLFILASKFEGFGLAIFEAMASGVPVMISNLDSLKNIVGDNAIYFDLDDEGKPAKILISILNKEIDIKKMAEKAKIHAEKTVRRSIYISKLVAIYNEL